jgi:hypothetical protein
VWRFAAPDLAGVEVGLLVPSVDWISPWVDPVSKMLFPCLSLPAKISVILDSVIPQQQLLALELAPPTRWLLS